MSFKVDVRQLQEQFEELLDRAVTQGEECIIQRDGEDYAVLVGARQWRGSQESEIQATESASTPDPRSRRREIGRRLDALGPDYRAAPEKQGRAQELLARKERLTPAERAELDLLLREFDEIMLRRAEAVDRVL
jgi:antitoxin (DNA-binding transcriptional repressor) of toxin-antitoxin stability system